MQIERSGDDFRIHAGAHAVTIDRERFEDLFYAAETNPTAYYRVLVDSVCRTAAERGAMTAMINAGGDMEATIADVQRQVKALGL